MMILVSGATKTMRSIVDDRLGYLFVPNSFGYQKPDDRRWGADNGAFPTEKNPNGFNADKFVAMLEKIKGRAGCLFVACPDVVGNAEKTLELFPQWSSVIRSYGFPVALVGQDGLRPPQVPWPLFDAFFIGGSTEWKLGGMARSYAGYAKARGKWVHMGRVNTKRRLRHSELIGCDSVDGTNYSRWPDRRIPEGLKWMDYHAEQGELNL